MLLEILHAPGQGRRVLLPRLRSGHAPVELERAQRRHQHHGVGPDARSAALDVEELLGPEVEAEAGLGEHHLGPAQGEEGGHDAVAAVGDVAEGAAVHEGGRALGGLHEVREEGVAEQRGHGPLGLEVAGVDGLAAPVEAQEDAPEPLLQVGVVARQAQDRHHLAGRRDVEPVLARHPHGLAAETDDGAAQEAVVHVEHAAEGHLPVVQLATVAARGGTEVDVVVGQGGEQVVGRGDRVEVAGEMQVDASRGLETRHSAARAPALLAEHGAEGRLAQRAHGFHADLPCRLGQADRAGGLALARGGGADGGDEHEAGLGRVGSEGHLGADLGHSRSPGLDVVAREAEVPRDVFDVSHVRDSSSGGSIGSIPAASAPAPSTLFPEGLELGDRFEILGPARGALHLDELVEFEAAAAHAEHLELAAVWQQGLVASAARDLTEHVQLAPGRSKGEVQPAPHGVEIEAEG